MSTISVNPRLEGLEYRFSVERLVELNRSPVSLLLARLNRTCPSYGKGAAEVDDPARLIEEIRANCADDADYILQAMPLQEIVFRTLLLAEDHTLTLQELHHELTERWSSPIRPITVTVAGLARILDNDVFYGFELLTPPEPEVVEPDLPMLTPAEDVEGSLMLEIMAAIQEDDEDDYPLDDEDEDEEDDPYEEDDQDEDEGADDD